MRVTTNTQCLETTAALSPAAATKRMAVERPSKDCDVLIDGFASYMATNRLPVERSPKTRIAPEKSPSGMGDPINADDVVALLPFHRSTDRERMCRLYGESLAVLTDEREKAKRFLTNASKCNDFLDSVSLPDSLGPPKDFLTTEWAKGEEGMAVALAADLRKRAEGLVKDLAVALTSLVGKRQAGTVEWTCEDACNYEFFKYRVTDEQKTAVRHSESRGTNTTKYSTETDSAQTHKLGKHCHGLVAARRTTVDDPSVTLPTRVKQLIKLMPTWVQKVAYLVVGTLVHESLIEWDVKTEVRTVVEERIVYHPVDPCLAIGKVVLTGWTTAEVQKERHEETQRVEKERRERAVRLRQETQRVDEQRREQAFRLRKEAQQAAIGRTIIAILVGGAAGALFAGLLCGVKWLTDKPLLVLILWFILGCVGSLLVHLLRRFTSGHESDEVVLVPMGVCSLLGICSAFVVAMPGTTIVTFGIVGAIVGLINGVSRIPTYEIE